MYTLSLLVLVVACDAAPSRRQPWQINQGICPPVLCDPQLGSLIQADGRPQPPPQQQHDFEFFEGDIVLQHPSRNRQRRSTVRHKTHLWPHGQVPYVIDQGLSGEAQWAIEQAIQHYHKNTCIRFIPKTRQHPDFVMFVSGARSGCWSEVGKKGGMQYVSVGTGCEDMGTVVHEMGHVLGFWHEQSRMDRNRYVKIVKRNISPQYLNQFERRPKDSTTPRGYPYDYGSIMHYGPQHFSWNSKDTIKVIGIGKKLGFKIGQRKSLSDLDIAQLSSMYKCNKKIKGNCTISRDGKGRDYRGRLSYTEQGVSCQHWSSQYPHTHNLLTGNKRLDARNGLGNHNFCRNPNGLRDRPWCFTTKTKNKWQYCAIQICEHSK